jgi:hypothetical protein
MPSPDMVADRLAQAFKIALEEGLHSERVDPSRVSRLRISSFPFCPVKWFMGLDRNKNPIAFLGSHQRYYTRVGHVLHDVMQSGLLAVDLTPTKVEVVCDWVCLSCKHRHFFTARIAECTECGHKKLKAEEHEVDDYPVMGHIDNVFRIHYKDKKDRARFVYVVIDYKTTSFKGIKSGRLPYKDNQAQLRAYANEIRRRGEPVLPFVFLVYVPRDNPNAFKLYPVDVDFEKEEIKRARYVARFLRVIEIKRKSELMELLDDRPCRSKLLPVFEGCKLAAGCAGESNRENIEEQVVRVFKSLDGRLPLVKFLKAKDG